MINKAKEKLKKIPKKVFFIIGVTLLLIALISIKSTNLYANEYTVKKGEVTKAVLLSGVVKSVNQVELAFENSGKISNINVKEGEAVKAGQVLASLNNGNYEAEVKKAEANLAIEQKKLQAMQNGTGFLNVKISDSALQLSNTELQNSEKDLIEKLKNIRAETKNTFFNGLDQFYSNPQSNPKFGIQITSGNTTYSIDVKGNDFGQRRKQITEIFNNWDNLLFNSENLIPSSEQVITDLRYIQELILDISEETSKRLTQGLENEEQNIYNRYLNILETAISSVSGNINNLNSKLQSYILQASTFKNTQTQREFDSQANIEEINIQLNNIEIARAELFSAQEQLKKSSIIAPFSGVVGKISAEKGESISNTTNIITLFSNNKFQISVNIPEIDVAKVKIGDKAFINLDAYDDEQQWEGILENIELVETEIDGVPVYVGDITITNPDERIRIGMNARSTIELNKLTDVIAVPSTFITKKGSTSTVQVKKDEKTIEIRQIQTGLNGSNSFVEVKNGLSEGEILVKP